MKTLQFEIQYYDGICSRTRHRKHIEAESEQEALDKFLEWSETVTPRPDYAGMVEIPLGCI